MKNAAPWWRATAWLLAAAALGAVFTLYLNPHLARDLADWWAACF